MHTDTDLADPLRELREHLSARVNSQLHDTARIAVLTNRAVTEQGWTVQALAAECMRDHHGVINPAGIVMHRLEWAANHPPAVAGTPKKHHGCCDNGWLYDETTDPPTVVRCDGKEASA